MSDVRDNQRPDKNVFPGPLLPHPMITWIKFLVLCYDLKAYFCLPHSLDLFYNVWLMIQWQAIPIVANNLSRNFFILAVH